MEIILLALQAILAPLSAELILTGITAGLFFGVLYNAKLKLSKKVVYHELVAGIGFLTFMFIWRMLSSLITGAVISNPLGWIGIALLWGVFCLFIWIGQTVAESR